MLESKTLNSIKYLDFPRSKKDKIIREMPKKDFSIRNGKMEVLRCVRCETSENIGAYRYSKERIYFRIIHIKSGTVPACKKCKRSFNKWKILRGIIAAMAVISFFIVFILGYQLFFERNRLKLPWEITPLTLEELLPFNLMIIATIVFILIYLLYGLSKNNPSKYVKVKGKKLYIKNKITKSWILMSDWISEEEYQKLSSLRTILVKDDNVEKAIFKYLMENQGKAFTIQAIKNKALSGIIFEVNQNIIEETLNKLVIEGKIKEIQKNSKKFYLF